MFASYCVSFFNIGIVYLANFRMQKVAVKKIKEADFTPKQMSEFIREAEVYMALRPHKNTVVFLGVCTKPLCICTLIFLAMITSFIIFVD